jgi:hypothetical protein
MLRRSTSSSALTLTTATLNTTLFDGITGEEVVARNSNNKAVLLHDPSLPRGVKRALMLAVDGTRLFTSLLWALPWVVFDALVQSFVYSTVPGSLNKLLNPRVFAKVTGRAVISVVSAEKSKDLTHTTDRIRLRVRFEGDTNDTLVFAKTHAASFGLRLFMNVFDVYRNEINAYAKCGNQIAHLGAPRVHAALWSPSRFLLVLDDVGARGAHFPNVVDTVLSRGQTERILHLLARFHATYWGDEKIPLGVWSHKTRPSFYRVMGLAALKAARKRYPDLVSPYIVALFNRIVWRFADIDKYLDTVPPHVLTHGDSYLNNFYFIPSADDPNVFEAGMLDFQCFSAENPIRDVAYFLTTSYDADTLALDETGLVARYLELLREAGVAQREIPTLERAMTIYRIELCKVLIVFIIATGLSDLTEEEMGRKALSRVVRAVERLDVWGALDSEVFGKKA